MSVSQKIVESLSARIRDDFTSMYRVYVQYRRYCKVKEIANTQEIVVAMVDKLGRIARELKHIERGDPRPDGVVEMRNSAAGLIAYTIMLSRKCDFDIGAGLESELLSAVQQHSSSRRPRRD